MITNLKGESRSFTASYSGSGDSFNASSIRAEIDAKSVFTNNEDRDKHLKSEDFFDVENHDKLIFRGKSMEKKGDGAFLLKGDLTIKRCDG